MNIDIDADLLVIAVASVVGLHFFELSQPIPFHNSSINGQVTNIITLLLLMNRNTEAENLFKKLDVELLENIDAQYFLEPRDFR